MKKIKIIFLIVFFLPLFAYSQIHADIYNARQLIPAGHWIYDVVFLLNAEAKSVSFATNAPLCADELALYIDDIDYEKLSFSGKRLYEKVRKFLQNRKFTLSYGNVFAGFNLNANPAFFAKTNKNLDWSFATDYTGKFLSNGIVSDSGKVSTAKVKLQSEYSDISSYKHKDISTYTGYGSASNFLGSKADEAFIKMPLYFGFGKNVIIETVPIFAKSFWGMSADDNFINLAYSSSDFEFLWPRQAYGSIGKSFNGWGINLTVGRQGLQIGKTQTGSIILNSTFETDGYLQLNLYSKFLRYNLDIVQIDKSKNLYLHQFEARPFRWIKAGAVEGMLINAPFEVRFLNPFMIMHSFGAWEQYLSDEEARYYGEANVCAYMGIFADITPCKYFRIYALYAQNEIQTKSEKKSKNGRAMPDSLGGQLGFEFSLPDKKGFWWTFALEGLYTSPFLYIKQGADWSLYRKRYDMQNKTSIPISSWIGTPFGPDCIAFQAKATCSDINKWNYGLEYLFVAHGTNSFGLFENIVEINNKKYYAYYPSVLRRLKLLENDEAAAMARTYNLTGTIQYTNQITAKAFYALNSHLKLNGSISYLFVFNNKNLKNVFEQGLEFTFALNYSLL